MSKCIHELVCKHVVTDDQGCTNTDFCKHIIPTGSFLAAKTPKPPERPELPEKRKTGRPPKDVTPTSWKSLTTSKKDIRAALAELQRRKHEGKLKDNQIKALDATKGRHFKSYTEPQKQQMLDLLNEKA